MQEKTGELLCKIDHKLSSSKQIIIEEENNMTKNILGQTIEFALSTKEIKIEFENAETLCQAPFVSTVKKNVNYRRNFGFKRDFTNSRIIIKIILPINKNFVVPRFFYLLFHAYVFHSSTLRNLETAEEAESYCINEDPYFNNTNTDSEEIPFSCFLYSDNVSSISYIGNITSDYIGNIPENLRIYPEDYVNPGNNSGENNSTNNNTKNIGKKFFWKENKSKTTGLIIGIIFAFLLVVILVIIVALYNKKRAKLISQKNATDSTYEYSVD